LKNQDLFPALTSPARLVSGLAKHIGTALLYLGWFSLPVSIIALPAVAAAWKDRRAFIVACCAGCAFVLGSAVILVHTRGLMPTAGNIVLPQGVGPFSLRDMHILGLPHLPSVGKGFWLMMTAAALLGGGMLVGAAAGWAATIWPSSKPHPLGVAQVSKPAVSRVFEPAEPAVVQPTWKSATQQVWKPALQAGASGRLVVVRRCARQPQ